jgi:serine/threonine protein kinase
MTSSEPPKPAPSLPPLPGDVGTSSAAPQPSAAGSQVALSGVESIKPGDVLDGRYVLQDPIGEGGVGLIYRAIQFKVQRPVAVKFLQREMVGEHSLKPRFEREAMALAALAHPNIVRLQDYGIARGNPFLVMEFVEGRTLRGLLNQTGGPLSVTRALALTRQLLHALAYAHQHGIVHRDLKPANLIVQELPQQPEHLKVLDFGFAKFMPGSELDLGAQLTRAGHTFGSPPYMSPEHATGSPVDGRSDIYSVGILLFEMLTAQRPFEGEIHELLRHHLTTPAPPLAAKNPELADQPELQRLIDRSLAKNREQRFANAGDFLQALDAFEHGAHVRVALLAAQARPREPSLGEVGRVSSQYVAAELVRFRRQRLPRFRAWSQTQLRRAVGAWRRLRAPRA